MTNVGKIGFNFYAMDEAFVRNLYVGWDSFYRDAFEAVVDEFLSRHNEEGRLLRLDRLDLNLGSISQDDFYLQFPVRLREELERVFLFQSAQVGVRESLVDQIKRRLACLKFYLEKGFFPTGWEGAEFEFEKEVRFLLPYASAAMARLFHESIGQSSQLYRLKWNLSTEQFGHLMLFWLEDKSISRKEKERQYAELRKVDSSLEPSLYKMLNSIPLLSEKLSALLSEEHRENSMSWLLSTTVSAYEKRRLLSGLLEWEPTVVIRYIHETQDEKGIHSLAVLLDKIMVRKIIYAECEDHTEADVPAYWIYLYNWLLKYYPFNGIYMFGNKLQFQEHLNMKLLQFIRKRSYSAFLSRADITIQFLMEVFGQEYYIEVLNVIYNQQAHNADGSPVYTDYLNMELYFMFLRLSLIKMPVQRGKGADSSAFFVDGGGEEAYAYDVQALNKWLADKRIGTKEKRSFLTLLVKEHPALLIKAFEVQPENQALLAELMDQSLIYELLSSVSFYATELFIKLADYLHSSSNAISWLSGVATEYLSLFIRVAMLRWIGTYKNRATDSQESVSLFLRILHQEVSSSTYGNKSSVRSKEKEIKETIHQVSGQLSLSDASTVDVTDREWNEERLEGWLRNPDISVDAKRSVIRKYIIWRPDRILVLMRRLINTQAILIDEWAEWLDEDDWIHMIADISLSKAELLEQIIVYLRQKQLVTENGIRMGIIRYLSEKEQGSWLRETVSETARRFILIVCLPDGGNEMGATLRNPQPGFGKDEIMPMVIAELLIKDMEDNMEEKRSMSEPEYVDVNNAGLVLLVPWFPRLFMMLGMLNGEKKDFKDMESRIRAIFILQRLVTHEDRKYKESGLAFNRILVGCPFYEPLPTEMELTKNELDIIELMLDSMKSNWPKVGSVSTRGIQYSFIERSGHLEPKNDKWLLSVDARAYDVLMDYIPWSYNRIQLPWLNMPIHVSWRSRQEF